jgi:hypothetical protein
LEKVKVDAQGQAGYGANRLNTTKIKQSVMVSLMSQIDGRILFYFIVYKRSPALRAGSPTSPSNH